MAWYAKPSGGYPERSNEWHENMLEIYGMLNSSGWTLEAVCGMCGGCIMESGMNPWRWQEDHVNTNAGYGLVQFTPASGYINLSGYPYHAPNMSTTEVSFGALATDGICQVNVVDNDTLQKWTGVTWRNYWDRSDYPDAYAVAQDIRSRYSIPMSFSTYKSLTDLDDAVWMFMSGYLGPRRGDRDYARYMLAGRDAYRFLSGQEPPTPTPTIRKLPLFFYLKRKPF